MYAGLQRDKTIHFSVINSKALKYAQNLGHQNNRDESLKRNKSVSKVSPQ
jgi:hypothetical protein